MSGKSALVILAITVGLFASDAHAYLDPGTGSMIIQMLIAGAIGALVVIKAYWSRIVGFFSRKKSDDAE